MRTDHDIDGIPAIKLNRALKRCHERQFNGEDWQGVATIRVTPAMAAGLSDHVWELSELIGLLAAEELRLAA